MQDQSATSTEFFVEPPRSKQSALPRMGIMNPSVETLSPARLLHPYKHGHSTLPDEKNLSSPWWSDYGNCVTLRHSAVRNSISLAISSRIQKAQTPEFGPANAVYKARLAAPLMVFQRLGRPMYGGDG